MTTPEFNQGRTNEWLKQFNRDESRIFIMIGVKQNGAYSFVADETQSQEKIAQKLEELAQAVRKNIAHSN